MSTEKPTDPAPDGRDFREAVAQWRLAVRTEVKQVSSLPTAMFDATDPMLEMQLAETTEEMLRQLHMPNTPITAENGETKRRLEEIAPEELAKLPGQIADRPEGRVDLLSQLSVEYIGILADSCCMQEDLARQRAISHLCTDFGVTADNLDETLDELRRGTLQADVDATQHREPAEIDRTVELVADLIRKHLAESEGRE